MNSSIINNLLRDWGTDPLFLMVIAGFPLMWFALRSGRRRRVGPWLFTFVWLALVLVSSAPVIVNPLVGALERQSPHDDSCAADTPIMLLSAGLDSRASSAEEVEYLYGPAHVRSARASKLALENLSAPVFVSGKGLYEVSEASMARAYLMQRGVEANRIVMDEASRNTYENAINAATVANSNEWGLRVRVVTSAMHMPRSIAVFESAGFQPCAIPVDFLEVKNVPWYAIAPQTTALAKFRKYLHERIGTAVYRYKGWIQS